MSKKIYTIEKNDLLFYDYSSIKGSTLFPVIDNGGDMWIDEKHVMFMYDESYNLENIKIYVKEMETVRYATKEEIQQYKIIKKLNKL
jgi:hypothetical protein